MTLAPETDLRDSRMFPAGPRERSSTGSIVSSPDLPCCCERLPTSPASSAQHAEFYVSKLQTLLTSHPYMRVLLQPQRFGPEMQRSRSDQGGCQGRQPNNNCRVFRNNIRRELPDRMRELMPSRRYCAYRSNLCNLQLCTQSLRWPGLPFVKPVILRTTSCSLPSVGLHSMIV